MLHINKYSTRNISLLSPFTKVGTVMLYCIISLFCSHVKLFKYNLVKTKKPLTLYKYKIYSKHIFMSI